MLVSISLQKKKKKSTPYSKKEPPIKTQMCTFSIYSQSVFKTGIILIKEQVYKWLWDMPLGM